MKRIYEALIASPEFEVIRVKNKLNEGTRDILINFKPRNSFLVCEMQLSLGGGQDLINDHFCHYLYELQRSVFPVIFEVASQVVNFDPRTSYFANGSHPIKFLKQASQKKSVYNTDGKVYCSESHSPTEMIFQTNELPYTCSNCCGFIGAYRYKLEYMLCRECGTSMCPKCTMKEFVEMEDRYLSIFANPNKIHQFIQSK